MADQENTGNYLKQQQILDSPTLQFESAFKEDCKQDELLSYDYTSKAAKILGGCILGGAIIGGSSIGVLANFIPVETSFAKNAWRSGLNATMFIFPALFEFFKMRKKINYRNLMSLKEYGILLITLMCQVVWTFGLVYASLNTI
jgi:drug/metabolite transporter (DMT)-like permease